MAPLSPCSVARESERSASPGDRSACSRVTAAAAALSAPVSWASRVTWRVERFFFPKERRPSQQQQQEGGLTQRPSGQCQGRRAVA